jgi:CDP-diacylglycerol--glycerol-3-phosphate 3-phosphatidyltransferase
MQRNKFCSKMFLLQDLSTPFGAFLDPVADKLMVCAVLVLLCTKTFTVGLLAMQPWLMQALAVAIISREIAMSALREWAAGLSAEARSVVAVNWLGKYKTTLQLVSLAMLVFAMNGGQGPVVEVCAAVGPWALIGAAGLTVYSFMIYFVGLAKYLL